MTIGNSAAKSAQVWYLGQRVLDNMVIFGYYSQVPEFNETIYLWKKVSWTLIWEISPAYLDSPIVPLCMFQYYEWVKVGGRSFLKVIPEISIQETFLQE